MKLLDFFNLRNGDVLIYKPSYYPNGLTFKFFKKEDSLTLVFHDAIYDIVIISNDNCFLENRKTKQYWKITTGYLSKQLIVF